MTNNVDTTHDQEVNTGSEETVNDEQDTVDEAEESTEETVGSLQDEETSKKPDSVPMARLDKEIAKRKELEKELETLKADKDADPDVKDTDKDSDVKALAEKLAKIEEKEKQAERDVKLTNMLDKALENAPEFKDTVNADAIKQMAQLPQNKDKTMSQLLEEVYGNTISGKRTTESTTPRGGAANTKVDFTRAQKDAEYRREVLSDPDLKKQYNEKLQDRIGL